MDLQTAINLQKFVSFLQIKLALPKKYLILCMHVQRSQHAGDTCKCNTSPSHHFMQTKSLCERAAGTVNEIHSFLYAFMSHDSHMMNEA